ncbi:hypothetical protein HCN44_010607 [Aphidius gifuensis]|uniref:Uncharacterized protein n=1 Tax=Aphidius gifuensis TaxID=684658 RepID=A0A834XT99_APHGI|nr:hypothetical protein HCN44_010607 [Aphidius gifuensis]
MFILVGMSTGLLEDYKFSEHLQNQSSSFDGRPLPFSYRDSIIHRVQITNLYKNLVCFNDFDHCAYIMHWNTFKKNIIMTVRYTSYDFLSDSTNNPINETQIYLLQDPSVKEPKNNKKQCRSGTVNNADYSICDYIIEINMNGKNPNKNCLNFLFSRSNPKQPLILITCKNIFRELEKLSVPMSLTTVGTFKFFYKHIDLKL